MKLYHGSPNDLMVIEPYESRNDGVSHGSLVYAHPELLAAHAFALKSDAAFKTEVIKGWCYHAVTSERRIPGDKYSWADNLTRREEGIGGFIYEFSSEGFKELPKTGEWVSPNRVIPEKKWFVTIEDSMQAGVQIFYVADPDEKYNWKNKLWREDPIGLLRKGTEDGRILWLNRARVINPILAPFRQAMPVKSPDYRLQL